MNQQLFTEFIEDALKCAYACGIEYVTEEHALQVTESVRDWCDRNGVKIEIKKKFILFIKSKESQ